MHRCIANGRPRRVWLAVADHWEPLWRNADEHTAAKRAAMWRSGWPRIADGLRDSAGKPPAYSFFYPEEEYRREFLSGLAEMVHAGIAEVEIHIHHDGEGRESFIRRLESFRDRLFGDHGLLREHSGHIVFGFIHGNWALDNSRPDGRWCGLNDEISILRDLGCYADFTMPSGNHPTQSRMLNTIYWCKDDPERPKSYDKGTRAQVGGGLHPDLLMVPGPLGLRWRQRLLPRMETGELACYDVPNRYRCRRWLDLAPQLGEDVFIKLHTHGAQEKNAAMLLNGGLQAVFSGLAEEACSRGAQLYFVSTWQMYRAIAAICTGQDPVDTAVHNREQTSIARAQ
jgi:hypothetical protein